MADKALIISITPREHRNISCLTLFSVLRSHGIDTELLFLMSEEECDKERLRAYLRSRNFAVIGISVTTDGFFFASRLTAHIREIVPEASVIWGGAHPTICPEECMQKVDNICVGEGDVALVEFVQRVFRGQSCQGIPGIWVKTPDGEIMRPSGVATITEYDTLPMNRYDWTRFYLIDKDGFRSFSIADYVKYSQFGDGYTILAARFCPYACTFCTTTFFRNFYKQKLSLMRRSVDNVIRELEAAKSDISVIKFINFPDDHFLSSDAWTREFIEKYPGKIGFPFAIRTTPEHLDDARVRALKGAGLASVQIGIQTGSARIQKEIYHRKFDQKKILEVSELAAKYKVSVIFDIIIHSEFEDDDDRNKTIELLMELERPFQTNVFSLVPYPGTELLKLYAQKGITPRLNAYTGGAIETRADKDDWYKQMAFVAGYISKDRYERLYKNRGNPVAREECYGIYLENLNAIARKENWAVTATRQ